MDDQPNVTQRKPSGFRPLHSFRLRTMFVVVMALAVLIGIARSTEELSEGIAFAIGTGFLVAGIWSLCASEEKPEKADRRAGCLLGCLLCGVGALAFMLALMPKVY
jgi:putative Ca2+/H+ antiporter (TMEM165/GDT1 family)